MSSIFESLHISQRKYVYLEQFRKCLNFRKQFQGLLLMKENKGQYTDSRYIFLHGLFQQVCWGGIYRSDCSGHNFLHKCDCSDSSSWWRFDCSAHSKTEAFTSRWSQNSFIRLIQWTHKIYVFLVWSVHWNFDIPSLNCFDCCIVYFNANCDVLLVKCNKLDWFGSVKRNIKLCYSENVFLLNVTLFVRNISLNLHQNIYQSTEEYEMPKSCSITRTVRCVLIVSHQIFVFFKIFSSFLIWYQCQEKG